MYFGVVALFKISAILAVDTNLILRGHGVLTFKVCVLVGAFTCPFALSAALSVRDVRGPFNPIGPVSLF